MNALPAAWHELLAMLLRRRRPSAMLADRLPDGSRFGAERGPSSSILVPIAVIGLIGDVPFSMVLVSAFHPAHPRWVHASILALALAGLGWAIAARSARAAIPHVVTDAALVIRDGFDLAIEVPHPAVRSVELVSVSRRAWMADRAVASADVLRASLLDAPNLAIEVDPAASGLAVRRRGRSVPPRRWILLYADTPAALLTALRQPASPTQDTLASQAARAPASV